MKLFNNKKASILAYEQLIKVVLGVIVLFSIVSILAMLISAL